jgi:hypothetical protein
VQLTILKTLGFGEKDVELEAISTFTGKRNRMTLPLSLSEFTVAYDKWKNHGALIQDAFPTLSPSEREFLMTGSTQEEWDNYTREEE